MRKREIWKEYPLNHEFENHTKVEVSNLGRIRTYNSYFPEGKNCERKHTGRLSCA